jgi:hypothetical protein
MPECVALKAGIGRGPFVKNGNDGTRQMTLEEKSAVAFRGKTITLMSARGPKITTITPDKGYLTIDEMVGFTDSC